MAKEKLFRYTHRDAEDPEANSSTTIGQDDVAAVVREMADFLDIEKVTIHYATTLKRELILMEGGD